MSQKDYYDVLGVGREAGEDEIKKAYRKKAFEFHPDRNPDDAQAEEKFKEAAQAYDVLRDANKRARYDQFGHEGVNGNGYGGFSNTDDIFSSFSDIFGDLFGFGPSRGPRATKGADLRYNLRISFRQAAKGDQMELKIPRKARCTECDGSGAEPGSQPESCQQCGGSGQVTQAQGFFRVSTPCPICRGRGTVIQNPCAKCRGEGIVQETRELQVNIPAGVDNGSRLRLRGEGEPGELGGPSGDLYVVIYVDEDKTFRRQGQDLVHTVEINMVQAALGATVDVPTLDEPVPLSVPKGTQSGEVFQLRGLGLPFINRQSTGDLLVEVLVATPTSLSKRQEELLEEFWKLEDKKLKNKAKSFFKRAKDKAMGD
ncbi:molecular chaperone DnaJ [Desulfovibrio ferrophilus]|uniref:Chaperone protein DnaJ n=1 Tax=Desulfovibrio ferrophilus TaxID=241368 RepID=A0A2Z6AXN4_9BACT|nr:molecular chaperone DnaJ [Desulfovibrio ferrophilus]BBD07965.1 chaperone protein DnaJ [Desulfovibrio ferrophilus]